MSFFKTTETSFRKNALLDIILICLSLWFSVDLLRVCLLTWYEKSEGAL